MRMLTLSNSLRSYRACALAALALAALHPVAAQDSAEIKLPVDPKDIAHAKEALALDKITPESERIFFFDTAQLSLFEHEKGSIILRARQKGTAQPKSTFKFRPKKPLPAEVQQKWEKGGCRPHAQT